MALALNFEELRKEYANVLQGAAKSTEGIKDKLTAKTKSLNRTQVDTKPVIDQAFRDVLLHLLETECGINTLKEYIVLCVATCKSDLTTPSIPVVLLGDIFDTLTLDVCEEMFMFVEQEVKIWKEDLFFMACKNNLLRMCNDLLRRLSRSSATVFCGRILLFLAKFFPFSERSGLNIVSEFNLENVTDYKSGDIADNSETMEITEAKTSVVIDYSLYCKFWSLQDFFRNPNQCYNRMQWKVFCSHATSILNTFQGLKLESISKVADATAEHEETPYFPKYLTSQKLLDLQIYDVNFRRFVLLQFLIMFQYLTSSVKFKAENYELKPDQKTTITAMMDKVYVLLKETPPDGENFAQIVNNILEREEYWNVWKNDGCPEFKKLIVSTESSEKLRRPTTEHVVLGKLLKDAHSNGDYYMASPELTKLWNFYHENLDACKAKDRDFLPSVDNYFDNFIHQADSLPPEDQNGNGSFGWRGLRLLARRSPHFFTPTTVNSSSNAGANTNHLNEYLKAMVRKVMADRTERMQENLEQMDAEIEENMFKAPEDEQAEEKQEENEQISTRPEAIQITKALVDGISAKVAYKWKKLAEKLGYKADEIKFFEDNNPTDAERAYNALYLWFEEEEHLNGGGWVLQNLAYILEGLEMNDAVEFIKNEITGSSS